MASLLGAVACQKTYFNGYGNGGNGPGNGRTDSVSTDEAADMAANSLAISTNGVGDIVLDVTGRATSLVRRHLGCGTLQSDTISRQSPAGSTTTYSYNLNYNFIVVCGSDNTPDSLSSSLVYTGSANGPNLTSSNSGSSIFGVTGLDSAATSYVVNGEYKSAGSFASKTDTASHGNNNVDIVITALTLTKSNRNIASGTATITITGDVPKNGNFSYTGNVVFNGDGTATLTLNGTKYQINLYDGRRARL